MIWRPGGRVCRPVLEGAVSKICVVMTLENSSCDFAEILLQDREAIMTAFKENQIIQCPNQKSFNDHYEAWPDIIKIGERHSCSLEWEIRSSKDFLEGHFNIVVSLNFICTSRSWSKTSAKSHNIFSYVMTTQILNTAPSNTGRDTRPPGGQIIAIKIFNVG